MAKVSRHHIDLKVSNILRHISFTVYQVTSPLYDSESCVCYEFMYILFTYSTTSAGIMWLT